MKLSDNPRYRDLELEPGTCVPQMRDDYPTEDPYIRLYKPEYIKNNVFDENYPYVDDSFRENILHWLGYPVLLYGGLNILLRLQMGLRFEGREWLKKYKKELAGGAITLGNHCHRHDAEAILLAVRAKWTTKIPMFAANFNTKDEIFLHMVGGIPIPPAEFGMAAMKKFNLAFDEFHERGYWFHIFPEAAKWDWYKPLRPFQKGAFTMAYKYGMPLVPCMITWRPRTGIYRLFGPKEMPLMTVRIGEPIIPDTGAPRKTEVDRLLHLAHERMEQLAGIRHNTWPASQDELPKQ